MTRDELLSAAIRTLTEAARQKRTIGAGTDHERTGPADFAEFVTLAVAGAAANIGSIEAVLAGRPGSWEADRVRQMLVATVGEDDTSLLEHRTEPLRVVVDVDDTLAELGIWSLYDEAEAELDRRGQEIGIPSITYRPGHPEFDENAYLAAAAQLEPATEEQEAARDAIEAIRERLEHQRQQEWAAYGEAFRVQVLAAATELLTNLPVPVEVEVDVQLDGASPAGAATDWDGPAWRIYTAARLATPLPGSGIAPRDYPHDSIADVERAAGRAPLARLESLS